LFSANTPSLKANPQLCIVGCARALILTSQVHEHNPWLAYSKEIHNVREWGAVPKVFDLLDERPLSPNEATKLIELILGRAVADLPNPQVDPDGYIKGLSLALKQFPSIFDVNKSRLVPWIDVAIFSRVALKRSPKNCIIS